MTIDPFTSTADSLNAPASRCFAITPDDVAELPYVPKALYVGSGGDIVVRPLEGEEDVIFSNTISGSILDIRVRAVRASGTSAEGIVGLV
ncbi:MAG: hypothetical protein V2I27_10780 [Erythrobacter sp.]|jgi:hypothetical protein|nr:hypothetical protein [Erythrobacter sp.]